MNRYSQIEEKFPREIVLLKATPCRWGKCAFCDYIEDNTTDLQTIIQENRAALANVTGKFGRLEVIDSASVFELPETCLQDIKKVAEAKGITQLVFEAHWMYRHRLEEIRAFFEGIDIFFKIGVESFDDHFRNHVLKKGMVYDKVEEVAALFDSPCLLVCVEGQTKEMIATDIDIALTHFKRCTINIFNNNTTEIKRDDTLYQWFVSHYRHLLEEERVEMLLEITDFGVG